MKKVYVTMLVFIIALSMLNGGLLANEGKNNETQNKGTVTLSFDTYAQNKTATPPRLLKERYYLKSGRYSNYCNKSWTIRRTGARRIRVHFAWIKTERYFDWVSTSSWNWWTGHRYDVWSSWCYGDKIRITLTSNWSITDEGFYIDKIEYEI